MGTVHFPTGNILVRDLLVYLDRSEAPYLQQAPVGTFPIDTLVVEIEEDDYRYIATRVKFSDAKAVVYREALTGNEDLEQADGESFFGFNVDVGLATVVDVKTRDAYCDFESRWSNENPGKNIYDDYFAKEFKKSYTTNPRFQRDGGDWINYPYRRKGLNRSHDTKRVSVMENIRYISATIKMMPSVNLSSNIFSPDKNDNAVKRTPTYPSKYRTNRFLRK